MTIDSAFWGSPFSLLASPESSECWAGRPEIRKRIRRLALGLQSRADSSIDLIWANLGAGKTHCLYHIQHQLEHQLDNSTGAVRCLPLVVELSEQLKSFLDLYRLIAPQIPNDLVSEILIDLHEGSGNAHLDQAVRSWQFGTAEDRALATEWFCAGRPHLRNLNTIGIGGRIERDGDALGMLIALAKGLSKARVRLVIMFDEFQRLGVIKDALRTGILSNVRSVFSQVPAHFSLILATRSMLEETAVRLLPDELRTLLGGRPTISLPAMDRSAAKEFIVERLACFRPPGYVGAPEEPFTPETLDAILDFIEGSHRFTLIPRHLLQVLGILFEEAMIEGIPKIDLSFCRATLTEVE